MPGSGNGSDVLRIVNPWPADALPPALARGPSAHHHPESSWKRTSALRLMLRPWEVAALTELASRWGVPVATAGWVVMHERLAYFAKRDAELGSPGLELVAASLVTRGVLPMPGAE